MKYLNNEKTGGQIDIKTPYINYNRIEYYISETPGFNTKLDNKKFNISDFDMSNLWFSGELDNDLCLLKIKEFVFENSSDWELSEDAQNWIFETKVKRLLIDNELVVWALNQYDAEGDPTPLNQLIELSRTVHKGFIINPEGNKYTVIYIDQVNPGDVAILAPYFNTQVFLQDKI